MDEKILREYLFAEVEIVERIISRMGNNSFLIKGWTVTLVVASILFEGIFPSARAIVALLPWLIFWLYDTNFLKAEREYRELYDWLINHRLNNEEYLLDVDRKNLKKRFKSKVPCYSQT
ncbi:MAG: hypothetical protein V3V81_00500, partial [Candidatus Bathyarchaeia archaeon]